MSPSIGRKILIIDPYEDFRTVFGLLLQSVGFTVATACDFDDAVTIFEAFEPELVLAELRGIESSRLTMRDIFKQRRPARDTVLIALASYLHADSARIAKNAGFDYLILKSASAGEMIAFLNSAIQTKQLSEKQLLS